MRATDPGAGSPTICFEAERVVEVVPGVTYWRLDLVLPRRGPGGADLVIEPGACYWHNPVCDAARATTLARLGYPFILNLTDAEIEQTPDVVCQRILAFVTNPCRTVAAPCADQEARLREMHLIARRRQAAEA